MRQGGVLHISVHILNHRMLPVGFVSSHRIDILVRGGGEEHLTPPQVEQWVLTRRVLLRIQFRDTAHRQVAHHLLDLRSRGERCAENFSNLGVGNLGAVVFIKDRIGVLDPLPCVISDSRDGTLYHWIHPRRDRYNGPLLQARSHEVD